VQLLEATDGNLYGIRNDSWIPGGTRGGSAFRLLPRPAPIGLTVRSAGSGRAQLAWRPVSDATGYRIWRRSLSGEQTVIATNVTATTFVDSPVTDRQRYYYVVTAMTSFGESGTSYEVASTAWPFRLHCAHEKAAPQAHANRGGFTNLITPPRRTHEPHHRDDRGAGHEPRPTSTTRWTTS
jgi:hypothetical protein